MINGTFEENTLASISYDKKSKKVPLENGQSASVELWDTAGEERFKSMTKGLIKKADAAILMYSISDRTSFENLNQWLADY